LVCAFAAGLLVLTWWRAEILPIDPAAPVTAELLVRGGPVSAAADSPLALVGAWHLESATRDFGGYSALIALADGSLLAGSDTGTLLRIDNPGTPAMSGRYPELPVTEGRKKRDADLEALALDRRSGTIWAAYEGSNAIERYSPALERLARVEPAKMRDWRSNGGPEAIVRLADGRFLVLAEVSRRSAAEGHPAVLFPGDPTSGDGGVSFAFAAPEGMRPVDMAQLPDGTVLVLLRSVEWYLPPRFGSAIAVLDPAAIEAGALWRPERVVALPERVPQENYEGLAVEPGAAGSPGSARLWLISDDNLSGFQRTLLVALDWR
jgi:hypothetical protein